MRIDASSGGGLVRLGVVGTAIVIVVMLVALFSLTLSSAFVGRSYSASFTEAGGLVSGDNVMVAGVPVGRVASVDLIDDHVDVAFVVTDSSINLGDESRAAIKAETALGKKALEVISAGSKPLEEHAVIPVTRTVPPYDVTEALSQLTQIATEIDTQQLQSSFNTVSEVLNASAPELRPALDGMRRFSAVINQRDAQLTELLAHTAGVSSVLATRDEQLRTLLADGSALLAELNRRSDEINGLIKHVRALSVQVSGLIADNRKQIGPALSELNRVLETLEKYKTNIKDALDSAVPALRSIGELGSAWPGFNIYFTNLPPSNLTPTLPNLVLGGAK